MGDVLTFPGICRPAPRIDKIDDLPPGAKAIVLRREGQKIVARMSPSLTDRERAVSSTFGSVVEAFHWARSMSTAYPTLYRLIIDEIDDGEAA